VKLDIHSYQHWVIALWYFIRKKKSASIGSARKRARGLLYIKRYFSTQLWGTQTSIILSAWEADAPRGHSGPHMVLELRMRELKYMSN